MVAWIGVGLGAASVAAWVGMVAQACRLWRRLRPVVAPYLAMFAPPPAAVPARRTDEEEAIYAATTGERFLASDTDD